jgi:hypothetical protein
VDEDVATAHFLQENQVGALVEELDRVYISKVTTGRASCVVEGPIGYRLLGSNGTCMQRFPYLLRCSPNAHIQPGKVAWSTRAEIS